MITKVPKVFLGRWCIASMDTWAEDAMDLLGPAFIEFDREGLGGFAFCAVQGGLDCRFSTRDGQQVVEFSWEGDDDGDPASGRGWAAIEPDSTIAGQIFIHRGDDSGFVAKRS